MENYTVAESVVADETTGETKMCSRLRTASEQRLYLAYRTLKYMARSHGSDIRKGIHLGLPVWTLIAKELNALSGVEKTPDMWRKTYTSAKYFVHLKFFRYLKTKKINKNCINWQLFSIKDLLYLQDLRSEGFPDMPDVYLLLKACEEKKNFLNDRSSRFHHTHSLENTTSNDSLQFSNSDDRSMDNFRESEMGDEQLDVARLADPLLLYDQSAATESGPKLRSDIKVEMPQVQCPSDGRNNEMVYNAYGGMHFPNSNDPADIMATVHNFPAEPTATTSAATTTEFGNFGNMNATPQIHQPTQQATHHQGEMSMLAPSMQHFQSHPSAHHQQQPQQQHHHHHNRDFPTIEYDRTQATYPSVRGTQASMDPAWDFEQRVLEINEKMLREKMKHNKLLKKQNRLLEKTRKEQRKQTDTLTKLLEQLVQRSA